MSGLGRRAARRFQRWLPEADSGLVILAYHLIGAGTDSPVDIPAPTFAEQMSALRRHARPVSLTEALNAVDDAHGDERRVVVTFDDAYENFVSMALPVLEEERIPATLYVPCDFVDGCGGAPIRGTDGLPPATWERLRELAAGDLVTIGSHTLSHPDLRRLSPELAQREIAHSRRRLEDRLGVVVDSFCYPRALWNRRLEETVRASYRSAVVAGGGRVRSRGLNPFRLPRVPIRRDLGVPIGAVLSSPLWLEEWLASRIRPWLH